MKSNKINPVFGSKSLGMFGKSLESSEKSLESLEKVWKKFGKVRKKFGNFRILEFPNFLKITKNDAQLEIQ